MKRNLLFLFVLIACSAFGQGSGEVIITEIHNRPLKPSDAQLAAALPNNPAGADETPNEGHTDCLLYTSPSPRDRQKSRMPSSA